MPVPSSIPRCGHDPPAGWPLTRVWSVFGRSSERDPPNAIYGPVPDPGRDATILAVRDALHAEPLHSSRVLEVTFTAQDPLVAAAAVNNAMDIYIKDQFTAKAAAVRRATLWLDERAAALRSEVRKEEDRIAAYRAEHNFAQGMTAGLDAEKISHLNENLSHARADLAGADARLDAARGRAGAEAQAAIATSVVPLRTSLEQLTVQQQAQAARLGPNHPDLESSSRQVEQARRAVDAEIARVVAATAQERRAATDRVALLEDNPARCSERGRQRSQGANSAECDGTRRRGGTRPIASGAGPHSANRATACTGNL